MVLVRKSGTIEAQDLASLAIAHPLPLPHFCPLFGTKAMEQNVLVCPAVVWCPHDLGYVAS